MYNIEISLVFGFINGGNNEDKCPGTLHYSLFCIIIGISVSIVHGERILGAWLRWGEAEFDWAAMSVTVAPAAAPVPRICAGLHRNGSQADKQII